MGSRLTEKKLVVVVFCCASGFAWVSSLLLFMYLKIMLWQEGFRHSSLLPSKKLLGGVWGVVGGVRFTNAALQVY